MADDNNFFDARADEAQRRKPTQYKAGGGVIWLCGENDVDDKFLKRFLHPPLVVTCKPQMVDHIVEACDRRGCGSPILFNIGFYEARMNDFFDVHACIKEALDIGIAVIIHCRSGIHRAALATVLFLMFGYGISFKESRRWVESKRDVELDKIIRPRWDQVRNKYTEDHRLYIEDWSQHAQRYNPDMLFNEAWPSKRGQIHHISTTTDIEDWSQHAQRYNPDMLRNESGPSKRRKIRHLSTASGGDANNKEEPNMVLRKDRQFLLHKTFIGVCVQDLHRLLQAATFGTSEFQVITCDFCERHRPGFRAKCAACWTVSQQSKDDKWMKGCVNHSRGHNLSCDDCIWVRKHSQERCRSLVTKAFASLLHRSLQEVYSIEPLADIQFPYPGIVPAFNLSQLMETQENCENFLQSLWAVNGDANGSVFFYQYGCTHRDQITPFNYIAGVSWQLILPFGIANALIQSPRAITQRPGLLKPNSSCR